MEEQELEDAARSRDEGPPRWLARNAVSAVGYVLLVIHIGLLLVAAAGWPGMSSQSRYSWADAHGKSTLFTMAFAGLFLWIGELIRRKRPPASSYQGRHHEQWVPRSTHVRMLTLPWHVLWSALALTVAVVLLWLSHLDHNGPSWATAVINGLLLAAIAGAFIASAVKKKAWSRSGETKQRELKDTFYTSPDRTRHLKRAKFWSWFSARFFIDNWCVGVGFALWWFAAWLVITDNTSASGLTGTVIAAIVIVTAGIALVVFGLWATTQFWRSGADLESGEYLG